MVKVILETHNGDQIEIGVGGEFACCHDPQCSFKVQAVIVTGEKLPRA